MHDLIGELLDRGHEVAVETGGSLDISRVDPRAMVVMDVKCPGSGMSGRNLWANLGALKREDEVKFVLADRADYEYARDVVARHRLEEVCGLLFSPVHGTLDPRRLAGWILEDRLKVRLQLQIHKYIWPAGTRGV